MNRAIVILLKLLLVISGLAINLGGFAQRLAWQDVFDSGELGDRASNGDGIVRDALGNAYVAVESQSIFGNVAWVVKYDRNGNKVWQSRLGSGSRTRIALTSSEDVFAVFRTQGAGSADLVVQRLSKQTGTAVWESIYDRSGAAEDFADIARDDFGNLLVAVNSEGEAVVLRFNGAGDLEEYVHGQFDSWLASIAVDATGYALAGRTGSDTLVIRLNDDLTERWSQRIDLGGTDEAFAVAIDSAGAVFTTGAANRPTDQVVTMKFAAGTGSPAWGQADRYESGQGSDFGIGIKVDPFGDAIVLAQSASGAKDFLILKIGGLGNRLATRLWEREPGSVDVPTALEVDRFGNIAIAGSSGVQNRDFVLLRWDGMLSPLWPAFFFDGGAQGLDQATSIFADGQGNVWVTGFTRGSRQVDQVYTAAITQTIRLANQISAWRGFFRRGSVIDFYQSDDMHYIVLPRPPLIGSDPDCGVNFETIGPTDRPSALLITAELACTAFPSNRILQQVQLFNFQTLRYEVVDQRSPTAIDSPFEFTVESPARFVEPVTGRVAGRIGWFNRGSVAPNFECRIDLVRVRYIFP
jgi:hypothetical protein